MGTSNWSVEGACQSGGWEGKGRDMECSGSSSKGLRVLGGGTAPFTAPLCLTEMHQADTAHSPFPLFSSDHLEKLQTSESRTPTIGTSLPGSRTLCPGTEHCGCVVSIAEGFNWDPPTSSFELFVLRSPHCWPSTVLAAGIPVRTTHCI